MSEGTIYFEFRPSNWPLSDFCRLERVEQDGSVVDILCFSDGHLALRIKYLGEQKEYHFQRVNIPQGCVVKLCFSWNLNGASAAAGGELLAPYEESRGKVLDLSIKGNVTYEMGQLSIPSEVLHRSSRDEWLFLETLGDITRKLTTASRYDLVRLSALLRQLLCDSTPLAIAINRKLKQKLLFEVAIRTNERIPEPEALLTNWRSLYPDRQEEVIGVDLNRFLKLETISHHSIVCTVHDVIDVVAHVFGGVHLGQLLDDENRVLEVLEREVLIYDESLVFHSLHDIGRVTLKALMPLAKVLIDRHEFS